MGAHCGGSVCVGCATVASVCVGGPTVACASAGGATVACGFGPAGFGPGGLAGREAADEGEGGTLTGLGSAGLGGSVRVCTCGEVEVSPDGFGSEGFGGSVRFP